MWVVYGENGTVCVVNETFDKREKSKYKAANTLLCVQQGRSGAHMLSISMLLKSENHTA